MNTLRITVINSFGQKYIICVNSMNLLKNRFYTLSEIFIVELLLTTIKLCKLYEYLPEQMKKATNKNTQCYFLYNDEEQDHKQYTVNSIL